MSSSILGITSNHANTGTAISVTPFTGTIEGDVVICIIHGNGQTTTADNNGGTPFTKDLNDYKPNTGSGHTLAIWSRRIQAGDPATYNFILGASGRWSIQCITIRNPNLSAIYNIAPSTSNAANVDDAGSGTFDAPTITTTTDNAIHFAVVVWDTSSTGTISTTGSGYSLASVPQDQPLGTAYKVITPAGATGAIQLANTEFGARISISFAVEDEGAAAVIASQRMLVGVGR